MNTLRFENDRGQGWQMRSEGSAPPAITLDQIKRETLRLAVAHPARAILNGEVVFESAALTKAQARSLFGV
ncbi:MAG: hypothetical protein ING08_08040 [Roseomonas sp.]|nr:hypothetical protein [Roseomonas sp.]MCA3380179.1 hypothetical protein [Roseomonas sp.]